MIEEMIKEYEQLKSERDYAIAKAEEYAKIYRKLGEAMNMDPARLLQMNVVSCETQRQQWSNKQVTFVAFEESIQNFE